MMAKKRHTAEQIIHKLREAEVALSKGDSLTMAVRKLGITEQTYYPLFPDCHLVARLDS